MDTLIYIDNYFMGEMAAPQKAAFELKIKEDPAFAEEVSFYLLSRQVAGEQAMVNNNERFKDVYAQYKEEKPAAIKQPVIRMLRPYLAAAAIVAALVIGWAFFFRAPLTERLADQYTQKNFSTLGVNMGGKEDSMQAAIQLFTDGKLNEALKQFEDIALRDTASIQAKKNAGIVSFRLGQYDKALSWFTLLGNYPNLYGNPGKFYQAVTLLKRNLPGDKQEAKKLLVQVVLLDLDEKGTAREWLSKL